MSLEARWWRYTETNAAGEREVQCGLCFHSCRLSAGVSGLCGIRTFDGEVLRSPCLGRFVSAAVDPVEKKPLYHWKPGSMIFSLGSVGCNMRCPFCQNHAIAQPAKPLETTEITPGDLIRRVKALDLSAVAYTYNEPSLQAEYIVAAAPLLREEGIESVLVSNGMYADAPADELSACIAAANIDIKTFDEAIYKRMGGSLGMVKRNVERMAAAGVHVELANLVVPGISDSRDDFAAMVEWIAGLSKNIPLHISRYFPSHRYNAPPTDINLMKDFVKLAGQRLSFVHLGNVRS